MTKSGIRDMLSLLPKAGQELKVLGVIDHFNGRQRDWFAVELRPAFDRLAASGLIEQVPTFRLTDAGRSMLSNGEQERKDG